MKTREEIMAILSERNWYRETALTTKYLLQSLPSNCDGMLEQLADRPDEGGGVKLVRLAQLDVPNHPGGGVFGVTVVFEVEKLDAKKAHYTYQYHIWKQGPKSGTKGVVLLARKREGRLVTADDITHVVCLKGFSFAVGADTYDCVGGFADKPGLKLGLQFLEELQEELGVAPGAEQEVIPLGEFFPDRGQTANCSDLVAVIIDASVELNTAHDNPDPFEMRSGGVAVPVSALWGPDGFVMKNRDGYFGNCLLRLLALGRIKGPV